MNYHLQEGTPGLLWGGITALLFKTQSLVILSLDEILKTALTAAIGATVGFFIHLVLRKITQK